METDRATTVLKSWPTSHPFFSLHQASDVSQFLEDVGHVFGASLPKSLRRHATLVLALTRVAWHHVAYSAPNVYSLLSVELRAGKG